MSQHVKTTTPLKKILRHLTLAGMLLAGTELTFAQENGEKPSPLVPNLTVNIKLNSALGEKETEFYSKIAQDLISKLPRELNLGEQENALKDLDDAYKHLNVVTYFPPTDNVDTDKLIKHFKVRFVFDDTEGAKTADEAKDIVLPKALQDKHEEETIIGLKTPDTNEVPAATGITPMPDRPSMIEQIVSQNNKVYEPVAPELKPTVPAVAAVVPAPKPVVVAAVTPKPALKQPSSPTRKINKLRIAFETDETNLSVEQRVEVMKFVTKLRSNTTKRPDGFVFVVRSYEGPIGVEDNLGESRLRAVTALLRQQDINVSRSRVTEIFVRTNNQQFVEVEPVY